MEKKIATLALFAILLLSMTVLTTTTRAATDEEIEASGAAAVAYLASVQNPDGSWGGGNPIAKTGLVLLKFVARAYELNKDPFDDDPLSPTYYVYADNVIAGFDYLFGHAQVVDITLQTHGDPDTNDNGKGITFDGYVYYTGIALTAIAFSGHPDDRSAVIGTLGLLTYREIAQDIADWLYFAQGDTGDARGGFNYDALDNAGWRTDNSNGGYAYLGLAFAEDPPFSCTVPDWVRGELNIYIDYIQNDVDGDTNDGGSGYDSPDYWVNILKTGNLIFEMAFYGDTPDTLRVQDAVAYLERHWQDANTDPGWGYSLPVANYQAKFLVEKGLTYMGIDELDTDGDKVDEDWFNQKPPAIPAQDFASVIVQQQLPSGRWPNSNYDDGDGILSTAWAVLTLERFAPPPELTPGKVTGGGQIAISLSSKTGKASFGFNVMYQEGWAAPKGELQYVDHTTKMTVHGPNMTSLVVSSDKTKATFSGECKINGVSGFKFKVYVEDNGEPGKNDVFKITLSNGYLAGGTLLNGNIQIHKKP
jgi:hypothetical protein